MKTELTIALEAETVEQATRYAAQTGQELRALLIAYVQQLAQQKRPLPELPPEIQALRGSIRLPEPGETDYKQLIEEEMLRKYGARDIGSLTPTY